MLPDRSTFLSQSVHMYGYVFHDTHGRNPGQTLKILWYLSNEICTDTHVRDSDGRYRLRKFKWNLDGNKYPIWNVCLFNEKKVYSCRKTWDNLKMAEKKQSMAPAWKKLKKNVDLDEPTTFLDHVYLGCTQREYKPKEIIIEEFSKIFESRISAGATEKILVWEKPHAKNCCVLLRHGRTCSKMPCAILRGGKQKKWSSFTKFQVFAWMIINSNERNLNPWENFHKFFHKLH